MAGWLDIAVLFSRVYGPRHKHGKKRPILGNLDRTSLVNKGFIIWLLRKFFLCPERAR